MAALIRCGLRKSRSLSFSRNILLKECKKPLGPLPLITNARCLAAVPEKKKRLLIDVHSKLDRNIGISTEQFNSLLSLIEEHGSVTEHDVALLLHICSSGPFDSSSSDRLQFAEKIWNKLEEMSVEPTSKLYNMKLKVLCSNDKSFTPIEELAAMKSFGICPDKVTYGYLIEGFCQNGDISGANHVLEAMNDAQLYISVSVFNSFITGHLKSGSPEEALSILETMRSRGLSPNSDTYYRFIHHYGVEGDMESVLKYLNEADTEGVSLDQNSLMKIYRSMLLSGRGNEAKEILPMLLEKDVFRNSSMQNLCHLVAEGFHDVALNLYLNIPKTVSDTPVAAGAFLLKSMILTDQDAKEVIETADKLLEANPSTTPHRFALVHAYRMDKPEVAVKLLEVLMSQKHDVRIPQILPALCYYRDTENLEGVYKAVDMILSVDPCEELVDVLEMFCYPALQKLNQSKEDILKKMKAHEKKWNTFFMLSDLQRDGCAAAIQSVEGKPLDNNMFYWMESKRILFVKNLPEEKEACVKLLAKLNKKIKVSKLLTISVLINRLYAEDLDTVNLLLDVFIKEKIRLPNRSRHYKKITEAPEEIQNKLKEIYDLQPYSHGGEVLSMKELKEKTKEELVEYVRRNPNQIIARVALLNKALFEKNLTDIQKRLREIQALKFSFPKFQLIEVITVLTDLGEIETAKQYFTELQETHGQSYVDTIPLSIAVKLVEAGNIKGALEMIDAAKQCEDRKQPGKEYIRRSKIAYLFNAAKTMEDAEAIHEALVKGGSYLVARDADAVHNHYIRKALDSDDDTTLLERLTTLRDHYWVFPCMDWVITKFIKKQDIEGLKKVMDLAVSVVGKNVFHHKLACNFIACDMPSKAASVFQKLDVNLNSRLLETSCNYFIKNQQVKHVESLVEIVKTLPVSRAVMLKKLIEAYVSANELVKAADVLHTYDNEFLVPHKSSLDSLVASFRSKHMEQPEILKAFLSKRETLNEVKPYDKPHDSESSSSSDSSSSDSDSDNESTRVENEGVEKPSSDDAPVTETKTP